MVFVDMIGQMLIESEFLLAVPTLEVLLFGMGVGMGGQAVVAGEALTADQTDVRSYALVAALVFDQVSFIGERLVAEGAGETHLLHLVHPAFVGGHEVACSEALPADVALDGFETGMLALMVLESAL